MARFKIISKDGQSVRYEGKPRYNGTYLKPSCLEFGEISSPTPIAWEVGDYVDYSRTGMRYYLYSIPQPSKNAKKGAHGGAFTYSAVQFHAASKELEIALFRDIVDADNGVHFSTSPDVATFEDVYGIARRIQACMDDIYPGRWNIRVADFSDAEAIENVSTAKDFALSGGTCLDALSKIYELWRDIGWIHTHEDGVEVITIGYSNSRVEDNTTAPFIYGKGNGLTAIRKSQSNKDEFATRLYVYGSDRNLPARYYNGFGILNAESVDIRNLMLPVSLWGTTDGKPDASKAYLENADAVAKYGIIPKVHYFDSEGAGSDIHPTIERMTVGEVRKFVSDNYSPSFNIYPNDSERVDEVLDAVNPDDDGVENRDGNVFDKTEKVQFSMLTRNVDVVKDSTKHFIASNLELMSCAFAGTGEGRITFEPNIKGYVMDKGYKSVNVRVVLSNIKDETLARGYQSIDIKAVNNGSGAWDFTLPKMSAKYKEIESDTFVAKVYISIDAELSAPGTATEASFTIMAGSAVFGFSKVLPKTFELRLKQIGFSINERASIGSGKTISMKTGMCAGRDFIISDCRYNEITDSWVLDCRRQKDETLGTLFPNADYPIYGGDRFVLTDIAMPDLYISIAMDRLLAEGQKLLDKVSRIQSNYKPMIDAKVMAEQKRSIREGMYMEISDDDVIDNKTDYILIDTLSIYEDESAIPTYEVTLRERRKVTYKGTPSATSESRTSPAAPDAEDNSTDSSLLRALEHLKDMFYWHDEAKTTIATNHSLIVKGEMATAGKGAEGSGSGSVNVMNSWSDYNPNISQALGAILGVELHERLTSVESGLSEYATISFVESAISDLIGGADGAYDTLLEIQQILQDNEASIGTILEEIGKKASKEDLAALELRVKAIEDAESEDMFAWADEEHTTIETEKNLVVKGEFSDGGVAENITVGVTSITVDGVSYPDSDRDGVIDLSDAFKNVSVNLDNYYTKEEVYNKQETYSKNEVNELVKGGESDMFAWADEAKTTIKTEKNLIVEGEFSDSGVASNVTVGVTGIVINGETYLDTDRDGLIDLTQALEDLDVDLSDYYTRGEVNGLITDVEDKITVVDEKVIDLKGEWDAFHSVVYVDINGVVHVNADLVVTGDQSTIAVSGEGGSGGYANIGIAVGTEIPEYPNTAGIITLSKELITSGIGLGELAFKDVADLSSDYLPLSGGTIEGNFNALSIKRNNADASAVRFENTSGVLGYIGFNDDYNARVWNKNGGDIGILIHSGNVGDYALKIDGSNAMNADVGIKWTIGSSNADNVGNYFVVGTDTIADSTLATLFGRYATFLNVAGNIATYRFQLASKANSASNSLVFRSYTTGGWNPWKTIAFTDSTVEKAKQLANARTIWGQSFDGTGNVSGSLYYVQHIRFDSDNTYDIGTNTNSARYIYATWMGAKTGKSLMLGADDGTHIRINPSGNVTIGGSDLAGASAKLCVDGVLAMKNGTYASGVLGFSEGNLHLGYSNVSTYGIIITGKGIRLNTKYGNVIVGTNSSAEVGELSKLFVDGQMAATYYNFKSADYTNFGYIGREGSSDIITLMTYGEQPISIGTNSETRLSILGNGNVGIGTTSPGAKLSVYLYATVSLPSLGSLASANTVEFGYTGKYGTFFGTLTSGDGFIQQGRTDGIATTYGLLLNPLGGNVGIGTDNPVCKLDVVGDGRFTGTMTLESTLTAGATDLASLWVTNDAMVGGNLVVEGDMSDGGVGASSTTGVRLLEQWEDRFGSLSGMALGASLGVELYDAMNTSAADITTLYGSLESLEGRVGSLELAGGGGDVDFSSVYFEPNYTSGLHLGTFHVGDSSTSIYMTKYPTFGRITIDNSGENSIYFNSQAFYLKRGRLADSTTLMSIINSTLRFQNIDMIDLSSVMEIGTNGDIYAGSFNGYTLGSACSYSAIASVTSGSSSLVTSGAVYSAFSLFPSNVAVKNDYRLAFKKTSANDGERWIYIASNNEFIIGYSTNSSALTTRVYGSPVLFHAGSTYTTTNLMMAVRESGIYIPQGKNFSFGTESDNIPMTYKNGVLNIGGDVVVEGDIATTA